MMIRRVAARRDLVTAVLLMAIVLVGAAIRLTGIEWGRPFVYHPDEGVLVTAALRMVGTGDWNPHNFLYPSLLIDVEAGIVSVGHAVAGWPLAIGQVGLFPSEALPAQFEFYLAGRAVVATLGLITIVVTFAIGRRLGSNLAGLIAAAVVALAPIHIESSRFITTDVPVTLLCALTMWASIRAVDTVDRTRWWLVAAACVGFATSTKWNGIAMAIVPLTLYVTSRPRPGGVRALLGSPTPWLMVMVGMLALTITTPAVVLAPGEVAGWLSQQAANYSSGAYASLRGSGVVNGVGVEILATVDGFGPVVVGLAVLGIVGLLAARRPIELAMALFIIAYVIILSIPILHYPRNALPALPFIAVGIGLLPGRVMSIARHLRRSHGGPRSARSMAILRVGIAVLMMLAMVPALVTDVDGARRLGRPDTRSVAYAWILANLPHNAIVAREQYTPQFLPDQFRPRNHDGLYQRNMAWYREQKVQYIIASSYMYDRFLNNPARPFDDAFYRSLFALPEVFHIDAGPDRPGPTIRIFRLDPLPAPTPSP